MSETRWFAKPEQLPQEPPTADWVPRGTPLQQRVVLVTAVVLFVLSNILVLASFVFNDSPVAMSLFGMTFGAFFVSLGSLVVMLPWEVRRRTQYGHSPTAQGMRLVGWLFIGGGGLFVVANAVVVGVALF